MCESCNLDKANGQNIVSSVACNYDPHSIAKLADEIAGLGDLFKRRLLEDRQKNELIQILAKNSEYAVIEPFLADLFLLMDRMEKSTDEFVASTYHELYDILNRRGIERINVGIKYDHATCKAVRVVESADVDDMCIAEVIRNGYTFNGRVLRAADVYVKKPYPAQIEAVSKEG